MFADYPRSTPLNERVRVKICGVTCAADAELAIELGADALGLNFYPGSPRYLDLKTDAAWIRELPVGVRKVVVAVNPTRAQISSWMMEGVVDVVQLHGDEDEDFCLGLQKANVPFAKAIRVRDRSTLLQPERFHCSWLVIDAYQPMAYGGTGHQVDWGLAAEFTAEQRSAGRQVILSGGLKPENIAEAIRRVHPAGVDVASGVEGRSNPRRKDVALLREFFAAVRGSAA